MDYLSYIAPEMLVLVPVLYGMGIVLKQTALKDQFIPAILTVISVLFTILYIFSEKAISTPQEIAQALFTALTQGILIASASVYTNEVVKQAKK